MAIEIKKVYKEHLPPVRFVGKCYTNEDRKNGSFGIYWDEWFQKGLFKELEKLPQLENVDNGYWGLMGCGENEKDFQYWIGMALPENTIVPDGFLYTDIPEGDAGICWIYGREDNGELFGENAHNLSVKKIKESGMAEMRSDFKRDDFKETKWHWFFERYNCPRYTEKDDKGNVILDYGIYIK